MTESWPFDGECPECGSEEVGAEIGMRPFDEVDEAAMICDSCGHSWDWERGDDATDNEGAETVRCVSCDVPMPLDEAKAHVTERGILHFFEPIDGGDA